MDQRFSAALSAFVSSIVTAVVVSFLLYPRLEAEFGSRLSSLDARLKGLEAVRGAQYVSGAGSPALPPPAYSVATAAAEAVGPAVVGIAGEEDQRNQPFHFGRGGGSGFFFDPDGYIATNEHVVQGKSKVKVVLAGGKTVEGRVVGTDSRTDLAVVKVEGSGYPAVRFGDSSQLQIGEPAIVIGNPLDLEFQRTVTAGIISGLNRNLVVEGRWLLEVIQTDAAINPGNSGGPVVNARGEVIGVATAKISLGDVEGMGFAIPSNTARRVLADLVKRGKVARPWLGVSLSGATTGEGVTVEAVFPGAPAARAGVKPGDVILSLDGKKVNSYPELRKEVEAHRIGDPVELEVKREGTVIRFRLVLEEMPAESSQ